MQMFLSDRSAVHDAAELMTRFGVGAQIEAASRADRSRDLGNHIHFCRWRQVERLIALLDSGDTVGSLH